VNHLGTKGPNLMETTQTVRAEWWPPAGDEVQPAEDSLGVGRIASLEVERDEDDTNRVAIHTFAAGRGSLSSYYLDREEARRLALRLLVAAEV
jgi:hypothetical protein